MNDLAAERGRTDNNRTHVAKISAIWRTRVESGHRMVKTLADGWTLSVIARLASGSPLTITSGRDNNLDGNSTDRADAVPGANPVLDPDRPRSEVVQQWFNTAAFVENRPFTDGNTARNILDGPGYKIFDLGMYRDFGLGGRRMLQFRIEGTNAFNTVNLNNPTTNVRNATYGQIRSARQMRQVQLGLRFSF